MSAQPDAGRIEAAVGAEDADLVRELLAGADETGRRALGKALRPLLKGPPLELPKPVVFGSIQDGMAFVFEQMAASMRGEEPAPAPQEQVPQEQARREQAHQDWWKLSRTAAFAAFAVGVASGLRPAEEALMECEGRNWHVSAAEYGAIAGVLADRNPPWLAELVQRGLTARWHRGVNDWRLARRLVRLGAIGPPAIPEYGAAMVHSLEEEPPSVPSPDPWGMPVLTGTGGDRLARAILADPGLLEHEVWRLFTDPGVGKNMEDGIAGDQWTDALLELAGHGHLDRDRLLDACLDAFLRDFPPNHVGWYASFHDGLNPSDDEAAGRAARYLALLAARGKPGVALGQRMSARLMAAGRLDLAGFLAASWPALLYPQKSVAIAQLKLVGLVAAGSAADRRKAAPARSVVDAALVAAAQAFAHPREDVQAAALKLIGEHGVPADAAARAAIAELAEALSPVLLPDARALGLGVAAAGAAGRADGDDGDAAGGSRAAAVPAEPLTAPVAPVVTPEELIALLAQLIEDASDAIAVERALAGAVRLAALPLAERARLAGPLLKRARKQAATDYNGPFTGAVIRADLAWLTLTWATGEVPPPSEVVTWGWQLTDANTPWQSRRPVILSGILSTRIGEACTLIAAAHQAGGESGQTRVLPPLLAEPEFSDGSISPGELAAREALWAAAETCPPRYDSEVARLRAGSATGGGLVFEPYVTLEAGNRHTMLWQELHVERNTTGVRARLKHAAEPAPALAPSCWPVLTTLVHPFDNRAAALMHAFRLDELIACWPLLCPHDQELAAAHLLSPLSDGLGQGRNAAVIALRGLTGLTGTFGQISHLALVTGLGGASAEVRIAAADGWVRIAAQGRLDPVLAAAAIGFGVAGGALKVSRIADGLGHAALDPGAAPGVVSACALATVALLDAAPTGLHLLLELAATASACLPGERPAVPGAIASLGDGKGTSKLAVAARRLARQTTDCPM